MSTAVEYSSDATVPRPDTHHTLSSDGSYKQERCAFSLVAAMAAALAATTRPAACLAQGQLDAADGQRQLPLHVPAGTNLQSNCAHRLCASHNVGDSHKCQRQNLEERYYDRRPAAAEVEDGVVVALGGVDSDR